MTNQAQPRSTSNKTTIFRCLAIGTCILSLTTFLLVTICGLGTKVSIDGFDMTLGFWTFEYQVGNTFVIKISDPAIASIVLIVISCVLLTTVIFLTKGKNIFGQYSKTMTLTSIIVFSAAMLIFILAISNKGNVDNGGDGWIFANVDLGELRASYTAGGIVAVVIAALSGVSMLAPITVQLIKSKKK